jgi:hypothetical protein
MSNGSNWGLLSEQSLSNFPEEVRGELQSQATKQFFLNTVFGGGILSGLAAARAVPEQYQTAVEQRELDRQIAQAKQRATSPVMGEAAGPYMPGEAPPQMVVGQQLNTPEFVRQIPSIIAQAGPRAKLGSLEKILENQLKLAPAVSERAILDPITKQPIGFLPSEKEGIVTQLNVGPGGTITGAAAPLTGYQQARIATTLPQTSQNTQLISLPGGGLGMAPLPGAPQSVQTLSQAEALGKAAGELVEVTLPDGSKMQVQKSQLLGQGAQPATTQGRAGQPAVMAGTPSAPSAAQTAVNAAYEPILKDAYAGYKLASGRSGTLQSLRNALTNPNFDTNAFTPAKTALTGFLNATGVTGDKANQFLTNASAFRQGLNTIAAQSVSELPGAISNFELQFAQSRFGTMTDPKMANMYALDLMEVADKRKHSYYNFVQKNPRADVIEAWQNSPEGQKGIFEDPKLRKYLPQRPVASGANKGKTAYNLPSGEWVVFD